MFERGFKAWCERYSAEKRKELRLGSSDPLDPHQLASNLGIRVWTPHDVPGLSSDALEVLLRNDGKTASCWSAVTLIVGLNTVVILNSSHSLGRQSSDLMHELSHRILDHGTHEMNISAEGVMLLSAYDKQQEEEADWLSASLLLPRDALLAIKRRGLEMHEGAKMYGVSVSMLKYRMAMTGVNRQFAANPP